jgi:hypothetical protein
MAAPGAAIAQEPDRRVEGVAAPEEPGGGEAGNPGFDPGGETALPFETAPAPPVSGVNGADGEDEDLTPLEVEPDEDPDAHLVPPSEPDALAIEESDPVPPAEVVGPGELAVPTEPNLAPGVPTSPVEEPSTDQIHGLEQEPDRPDSRTDGPQSKAPRDRSGPDRRGPAKQTGDAGMEQTGDAGMEQTGNVAPLPTEGAGAVPSGGAAAEPVAQTNASATADSPASLRDSRFHVVAPGDSLWSIAKRSLGRDASIARIAREVDRLWSLNRDRIATGDPDLLMVGTRLILR